MADPRIESYAKLLVETCLDVQPGWQVVVGGAAGKSVRKADLLITVIKAVLFGFTIALICSHHGLSVQGATTEVPQQTTRAMLNTVTICLVLDIIVTVGFYL